jgi:hypothetical protein
MANDNVVRARRLKGLNDAELTSVLVILEEVALRGRARMAQVLAAQRIVRALADIDDEPQEADVLVWNTGRRYTDKGQRIAAARVPGGIVFADIDRNIDGFIRDEHAAFTTTAIMAAYDRNSYTGESYMFHAVRAHLEKCARQHL